MSANDARCLSLKGTNPLMMVPILSLRLLLVMKIMEIFICSALLCPFCKLNLTTHASINLLNVTLRKELLDKK